MSYLQSISRLAATDNLGGVVSLLVARKAEILSMPDPVNGVIYGEVQFQVGSGWTTWEVSLESANLSSQDRQSKEGYFKNNRLPFAVPKDRPALKYMFDLASDDEFIVTYKDANGRQKILGTLEAPVRFAYSHSTGGRFSDRNGYECSFFFEGPDNVFDYLSGVPNPPAGPALAIVRVNGTVVASLLPGEAIDFDTPFDFTFQIVGTATL